MTVVCPVFNEEKTVPLFFERFQSAMEPIRSKVDIELLFVNNRSTDGTLDQIRLLQDKHPFVHYITFSRNFGYQASITAGMRTARGDAVVNIDVDCEDPPELIPQFIEKWLAGADVAYGVRHRREEFVLMHLARKVFYRFTRSVADHEIVLDMAEFFLVDKRVRDVVLHSRSTFPFVRGQVGYVGFRREGIQYKRQRRIIGQTHYNLLSAARFGIAGILSSSTMPLRWLAYVGVPLVLVDLVGGVLVLLLGGHWGLSLATRLTLGLVALHAGWGMLAFAMLAIYLARVYKDSLGLPLYVIDDHLSTYTKTPA